MNADSTHTEDGASAVEYGLLVAGIAGLIVAMVFALGGAIGNLFTNSCGTIGGHITGASCGP
jgi:pilus assembly protein Flp/PilA